MAHRGADRSPGTTITSRFSNDTFQQVVGFYRALAKEYKPPAGSDAEKRANGQLIQKAFLIFDGAPDLITSRQWIRNQHPFIGPASDVRDVTEIVLTEIKPVPKQQGANPQLHEP